MVNRDVIPYSNSQKEILSLEAVLPRTVNVIICSVLYPASNRIEILQKTIERIFSTWPILSSARSSNGMGLYIPEERNDYAHGALISIPRGLHCVGTSPGRVFVRRE